MDDFWEDEEFIVGEKINPELEKQLAEEYNIRTKELPDKLAKNKKEWAPVFSYSTSEERESAMHQVLKQEEDLSFLHIFEIDEEEMWTIKGKGSFKSAILFVLPSPSVKSRIGDYGFPMDVEKFISDQCEMKGWKMSMCHFLYFFQRPIDKGEDSTPNLYEAIPFLFPYFMRKIEILRPRAVVLMGSVLSRMIDKHLHTKKREFVVTEGEDWKEMVKGGLVVRFFKAVHPFVLTLNKEDTSRHKEKMDKVMSSIDQLLIESAMPRSLSNTLSSGMRKYTETEKKKKKEKQVKKEERERKKKASAISKLTPPSHNTKKQKLEE